jgi:hypothetical protein
MCDVNSNLFSALCGADTYFSCCAFLNAQHAASIVHCSPPPVQVSNLADHRALFNNLIGPDDSLVMSMVFTPGFMWNPIFCAAAAAAAAVPMGVARYPAHHHHHHHLLLLLLLLLLLPT